MAYYWKDVLDAASGDIRRLSYVVRFSSVPVIVPENVADHSYYVALYSVLIHRHMDGERSLYSPIMLHAITHDLTEAMTGDLVRTFKYSSSEFKQAVDSAEKSMISRFPTDITTLHNMWVFEAGDQIQYVKAVVKAADFMSLHQYMIREVARGNQEIRPFFERMLADLRQEGDAVEQNPNPKISAMADLYRLMANTTSPGKRTA